MTPGRDVHRPSKGPGFILVGTLETGDLFAWSLKTGPTVEPITAKSSAEDIRAASKRVIEMVKGLNAALHADRTIAPGTAPAAPAASVALRVEGRRLTDAIFGSRTREVGAAIAAGGKSLLAFSTSMEEREWPVEFCVFSRSSSDGNDEEFYLGEECATVRGAYTLNTALPTQVARRTSGNPGREVTAGYAEDHNLGSACRIYKLADVGSKEEVHAVRRVVKRFTDVKFLEILPTTWSPVSADLLEDWLGDSHDVFHFNCHTTEKRAICLRDDARLRTQDIRGLAQSGALADGSMVFLNACSSGLGSDGVSPSMAEAFLDMEAEAVACTIGPVDDSFATDFAHRFYAAYSQGVTVSEAVRRARSELGEHAGHPLANLYTVVGNPTFDMRVANEPRR